MQTALDRRTFLKGAAAAGGGLASVGAVERLVARDALGKGRRTSAEPYGPLRRVPDQRGVEVPLSDTKSSTRRRRRSS